MSDISDVFASDGLVSNRGEVVSPVETSAQANLLGVVSTDGIDNLFLKFLPFSPGTSTEVNVGSSCRLIEDFVEADSGLVLVAFSNSMPETEGFFLARVVHRLEELLILEIADRVPVDNHIEIVGLSPFNALVKLFEIAVPTDFINPLGVNGETNDVSAPCSSLCEDFFVVSAVSYHLVEIREAETTENERVTSFGYEVIAFNANRTESAFFCLGSFACSERQKCCSEKKDFFHGYKGDELGFAYVAMNRNTRWPRELYRSNTRWPHKRVSILTRERGWTSH